MSGVRAVVVSVLVTTMFYSLDSAACCELEIYRQQQKFDALEAEALAGTSEAADVPGLTADTVQKIVPDEAPFEEPSENAERFAYLINMNPDFAAWINIENTGICYPVMYTPEDPDYYLRRNFYGEDSVSGTPYIGGSCSPDSDNVIVYGHNMKDGTMFSDLLLYESESFYKEHPVIEFDTVGESAEYEVIAAFRDKVHYRDEKGVFKYYDYAGELSEERFEEFLSGIRSKSDYDTGLSASYGDKLLMLSTCAYHTKNGRFVVVAVKRNV